MERFSLWGYESQCGLINAETRCVVFFCNLLLRLILELAMFIKDTNCYNNINLNVCKVIYFGSESSSV